MNPGDTSPRHEGEEPQAPRRLADSLRELASPRVFVPPTVDDAILAAARKHLSKPARPERTWFAILLPRIGMATAALILIGGLVMLVKPTAQREFAEDDVNRDGRVDILDAFQLARELASPGTSAPDLNSDGVADQRDVEILANRAVNLEAGGKS